MKQKNRSWALSWIVLAATGASVMGIGLYFIFLRPPLLPEDLRATWRYRRLNLIS